LVDWDNPDDSNRFRQVDSESRDGRDNQDGLGSQAAKESSDDYHQSKAGQGDPDDSACWAVSESMVCFRSADGRAMSPDALAESDELAD